MNEKSLLRKMIERGDTLSLTAEGLSTDLQITAASGKEVPSDWLNKVKLKLVSSIRQIKKSGNVNSDEIAAFFSSGRILVEEMTTEQWLEDYSTERGLP